MRTHAHIISKLIRIPWFGRFNKFEYIAEQNGLYAYFKWFDTLVQKAFNFCYRIFWPSVKIQVWLISLMSLIEIHRFNQYTTCELFVSKIKTNRFFTCVDSFINTARGTGTIIRGHTIYTEQNTDADFHFFVHFSFILSSHSFTQLVRFLMRAPMMCATCSAHMPHETFNTHAQTAMTATAQTRPSARTDKSMSRLQRRTRQPMHTRGERVTVVFPVIILPFEASWRWHVCLRDPTRTMTTQTDAGVGIRCE